MNRIYSLPAGHDRQNYCSVGASTKTGKQVVRQTTTRRRVILVVSCVVLFAGGGSAALASTILSNYIKSPISSDGDFKLYNYTSGQSVSYSSQAEFDSGTLVGTNTTSLPGSVSVTGTAAAPWWNASWSDRQCFAVNHTAAGATTVTEYPVSVTIDTAVLIAGLKLQSLGGDLRAIDATGNVIPLWIEGPLNGPSTIIWTQIPIISAGTSTSFCLYYGNLLALSVSDPLAPFTYTTFKSIYYPVSSSTASSGINVATFGPSNQVRSGATTVSLASAGATGAFTSAQVLPATPLEVTGPINGRGVTAKGYDSILPISYAGTKFVIPMNSNSSTKVSMLSPFGPATVTVTNGTSPTAGSPFSLVAGVVQDASFATSDVTAVFTSTKPILLSAANTNASFSLMPIPAAATTWYGVMPTDADTSFETAGSASYIRSNGVTGTLTAATPGARIILTGSGTAGGNGTEGITITASQPIEPIVRNNDIAAFMPVGELTNFYVLPVAASYISFVCPTVDTKILVGATLVTCVTSGAGPFPTGTPSKALLTAAIPAGTLIRTQAPDTSPFYLYYAEGGFNKETSLLGPKQGRQFTYPTPTITAPNSGPGTWESPVFNTGSTGVFGTLSWHATLPAGTSVTFQIASAATIAGPWNYVGPDDTAATNYSTSPGAIPFSFDGLCCVRILATLTPSGSLKPTLEDVTAAYNLVRLAHTAGVPGSVSFNAAAGISTTAYLVRVKTSTPTLAGSTATLTELGTSTNLSNLTSATAQFEYPAVSQIVITTGTVTTSVGPTTTLDATTTRSIVMVAQPAVAGVTSVVRSRLVLDVGVAGGSPLIDVDLDLKVVA